MPIDRRVERTQRALRQALFSLIIEKGYDSVAVKDICERANVGRTTFYAHFPDKHALKRSGLDQLRQALSERSRLESSNAGSESHMPFGFSLAMFEHARDHLHFYKALMSSGGGAIALETLRETLSDLVRKESARHSGIPDVPPELLVQFIVGGYMALLTWWLDNGAKLSPMQMDVLFRRLVNSKT